MTVRKNGADTGMLKTRMGSLIRDSAHHGMGIFRARFLIDDKSMDAITRRWRERPLPPRIPRRGFPHASTPHPAAGRTAAPARWRDRTFWSAKIRPTGHRRTGTATLSPRR